MFENTFLNFGNKCSVSLKRKLVTVISFIQILQNKNRKHIKLRNTPMIFKCIINLRSRENIFTSLVRTKKNYNQYTKTAKSCLQIPDDYSHKFVQALSLI